MKSDPSSPSRRARVEALVYNVSAHELHVSAAAAAAADLCGEEEGSPPVGTARLARPKFPVQLETAEAVEAALGEASGASVVTTRLEGAADAVPVGLRPAYAVRPPLSRDDFHWRHDPPGADAALALEWVAFPTLALVLPRWLREVAARERADGASVTKHVLLVCGFGNPRDASHAPEGNSTAGAARLAKAFIAAVHGTELAVDVVHSSNDVFKYGANVRFVNESLRPRVDALRDVVASDWGDRWKAHFHVTMALCDGTPARLQALMACFRDYEPSVLHCWQLKTFWHQGILRERDVEIQGWEDAEALPAVPRHELRERFDGETAELLSQLVDEVMAHRDHFIETSWRADESPSGRGESANELSRFWLRKTQKPVLSVLLVKRPGCQPQLYRGMNLEVSMPTGSLCSERNVIGTALANDPSLRRQDLWGIAVLSVPMGQAGLSASASAARLPDPEGAGGPDDLNPLSPCGVCQEWLLKIAESRPAFRVVTFADSSAERLYVKNVHQ